MAKAAIADNINENIFLEFAQIIGGKFGGKNQRFRVIAIHVQHRRLNQFRRIGTIHCRAGIERIGSGKADLVIDDNMQRAADTIAAHLRQLQRFHNNALSGKSGIAVNLNRHGIIADGINTFRMLRLLHPLQAGAH